MWGKGPNSSFSMWMSNYHSTICWRVFLSPVKAVAPLSKIIWSFISGSQSCSMDLDVSPYCKTCCLYRCSVSVSFKIGNSKFSSFAPLKNCFGYFVSFAFPYTFYDQIANFCPPEIHSHFDRNCIQSVQSVCIVTLLSLPTHEHWISPRLFRFLYSLLELLCSLKCTSLALLLLSLFLTIVFFSLLL